MARILSSRPDGGRGTTEKVKPPLQTHLPQIAGAAILGLAGVLTWLWQTHFGMHEADDARIRNMERRLTTLEAIAAHRRGRLPPIHTLTEPLTLD